MPQPSSIEKLPEDIQEKLRELLKDPRVSQLEATRRINEILESQGTDERLSKSAVNRYSIRMEAVGKKIREMREVSKMWVDRLGNEPVGKVGILLNELVRNLAMETALTAAEGDGPVAPAMLKDLAIAVEKLERAASENTKREKEIRKEMAEEAADTASFEMKKAGISADTEEIIRERIMGIA
jgi:hypothetical protein